MPPRPKRSVKRAVKSDVVSADVSAFIRGAANAAAMRSGDRRVLVGTDNDCLVIGIKAPSLCWEYLTQNNVLPFGRMSLICGTEAAGKSSLVFEMLRWSLQENGLGCILEHEGKIDTQYLKSFLQPDQFEKYFVAECDNINDWQNEFQSFVRSLQGFYRDRKAADRPGFIAVDSLVGRVMQETQDRIEKDGFAGRGFAVEALSVTNLLKSKAMAAIQRMPVHLALVCQVKEMMESKGLFSVPVRNKAGGKQKEFVATYEINLRKKGKPSEKASQRFMPVELELIKNSLGAERRKMIVNLVWYNQPERRRENPNAPALVSEWQWHAATAQLLLTPPEVFRTEIKKRLNVQEVKGKRKLYCPELGIAQENAVSFTDLGIAVMENTAMLEDLRDLFGVARRPVFRAGDDFKQMAGIVSDKLRKKAAKRGTSTEEEPSSE